MNIKEAIDFETYYFQSLLETIVKKSQDKLDEPLQQSVQNFVDFLSSEISPLNSIEKLAHLQGTSDLSIFFSDLIERINEGHPDVAIQNRDEYARDFLEIFRELAKDEEWQRTILQELLGETAEPVITDQDSYGPYPDEVQSVDFIHFVHRQIDEMTSGEFRERAPEALQSLEKLLQRLGEGKANGDQFENFRSHESVMPVISTWDKLNKFTFTSQSIEEYIGQFSENISEFYQSLLKLYQDDKELFDGICEGKSPVVEETPVTSQEEGIELIQSAEEPAEKPTEKVELTDEDKNLRWLLRDYIQHEIEELTREINNCLDDPAQEESQSIILDNLKVLRDLGQIHKYPLIESVSSDIGAALKQYFQEDQKLSDPAHMSLQSIFKMFPDYIDAVLENSVTTQIDAIHQLRGDFIGSLTLKPTVGPEVGWSEKDQIQPVFAEVNSLLLKQVESNLNALLTDLNNNDLKKELLSQINHLKFWFNLFGLSGGENILQVFHNWLDNPQQQEKLIKKQGAIIEALGALSENIFETTADDWISHMENLTRIGREPEEVSIDKSHKAFADVTAREIETILKELQAENADFLDILENRVIPQLQQITANSRLIENSELPEICDYLLVQIPLIREREAGEHEQLKNKIIHILNEISQSAKNLPTPPPVSNLKQKVDQLFSAAKDELEDAGETELIEETELVPQSESEEQVPDDQFDDTYKDETLSYLDELAGHLQQLSENLDDDSALKGIENLLHTINSSAQMLNRSDISDLAGPLENLTELIQNKQVRILKQYTTLCQKFNKNVRKRLGDKKVDAAKFAELINKYIARYEVETDSPESAKKKSRRSGISKLVKKTSRRKSSRPKKSPKAEEVEVESEAEQEPMLQLEEKDPELLDIFKNEAADKLDTIESQLNLIDKFRYDKQTFQSIDHAVHEIRSAAKMLGFSEIGSLVDHLEELVELIGKSDPENWREIIPTFRKCILVIRELTEKQQISQQSYDEISDSISNFVVQFRQKVPEQEPVAKKSPVTEKVTEEQKPIEAMLQSFLQEGREYLEDMNFLLMKIEKEPENQESLEKLLRSAHTLKGSSSMVYEQELEKLMHLTEELIEKFQNTKETPGTEVIDLFFGVVDEGEFILNALATGNKKKIKNFEKLIKDFEKVIPGAADTIDKPKSEAKSETEEEKKSEYISVAEPGEEEKPRESHLRMNIKQIDSLLNEAAELVINNNQFRMQIERFKNYLPKLDVEGKNLDHVLWQLDKMVKDQERLMSILKPGLDNMQEVEESHKNQYADIKNIIDHLQKFQNNFTSTMQGIKESGKVYEQQLQKITKLSTQIHDEIMRARLIPIGMLFQRFNRPLRDIAKKYDKKINFEMEGESTEIDRILADKLYEPMLHLMRNALDHGIETATERKKLKKPEEGSIQVSATRERNNVLITVEDDGKGIDVDKIRLRVIELGILGEEEIEKLNPQELYEFLMYPGFSTAEEVGSLSGRGIGMDIVRSQIHKLKGDLRIYSESLKFTRVTIRVPISITVTQAMLAEIAQNTYALPLLQVEETANVSQENLTLRDDGYFIQLRGMDIPVIHMSNLLKIKEVASTPMSVNSMYPVIIVQDEGKKAGLLVDNIVQREEILIKNIGESLQRTKFIMGGTILADGRVVLVLDIPQIVFSSLRLKERSAALLPEDFRGTIDKPQQAGGVSKKSDLEKRVIKGRKPLILIVDDSLSVRKFLSGMLSKNNYEVETAKNGQSAIEMLAQKDYDAIVTDLEMPRLSGYELIEQIRADSRWDKLPIIVLTGRASKQIEQQSLKLGANQFVIKPFKDRDLLRKLSLYIDYQE